jgi:hypothetical protein
MIEGSATTPLGTTAATRGPVALQNHQLQERFFSCGIAEFVALL